MRTDLTVGSLPEFEKRYAIEVSCQEFAPIAGIAVAKSWTKENKNVTIELPRYAIPKSQLVKQMKDSTC